MSWFGTDVVALSCILGSAAVGGAATLALMADADHQDHRCAVETVAVTPSVAVSHGSGVRAIVVKPNVRVRSSSDCARQARHVVTIHRGHEVASLSGTWNKPSRSRWKDSRPRSKLRSKPASNRNSKLRFNSKKP